MATNPPPSATAAHHGRPATLLAVLLLALFWWLAVSASTHWSHTSDELPHLTAGYAYDKFGDFRMQPENGNLPQRVEGLPGLVLGARFPMDDSMWRRSIYWQLGWDYLYGLDNATDRLVLGARALNALFGVALGAFIFCVARRWYGDAGGLLSLGLFILCPNFLAHSALATSDLAATFFLTLGPWCFWRLLEKRDLVCVLLAGAAVGLALVAKFNGVLLAPVCGLLAAADPLLRADRNRLARFTANLGLGVAAALPAVGVVWLFYGFRYSTAAPGLPPLEAYAWPWAQLLQGIGWKAGFIQFARDWHLMPEAWLYGLSTVLAGSVARPSFLAGEYSLHGWWQFFPVVFLIKTTLALLVAAPLALVLGAIRWRRALPDARRESVGRWLPLVTIALAVAGTAITSNLNIGHRHILAVYPVLFIAAGALATLGRRWFVLPLLLVAAQAGESFAIRPDYLAYFNPIAGGPRQAYRIVVDSSLDWGQGLPALRDWVAVNRRPGEKFYLSYFGSAWAPHYGVRPDVFLPAVNIATPPFQPYELHAGLYAISATSLAEVYSPYRGPWHAEWTAALKDPATAPADRAELRASLLYRYLRTKTPDAYAGYSILLFRLDEAELRQLAPP